MERIKTPSKSAVSPKSARKSPHPVSPPKDATDKPAKSGKKQKNKPHTPEGQSLGEKVAKGMEISEQVFNAAQVGLDLTHKVLEDLSKSPIPFIDSVLSIANTVIGIIRQTQANKAQMELISERIQVVLPYLEQLKTLKCTKDILLAVNEFGACIKECQEQATIYTEQYWFTRVLASGTDKECFEELVTRLNAAIAQLELGLNIQQTRMLETMAAREATDQITLQASIGEILRLAEKSSREQQENRVEQRQFFLDQGEQMDLLALKLQSIPAELANKLHLETEAKQKFLEQQFALLHRRFENLIPETPKPAIPTGLLAPFHEINFMGVLHKGKIGSVYVAEFRAALVAVKRFGRRLGKTEHEHFIRELMIMSELRHPNVVQFNGACNEPEACIVMEYLAQASLDKYLAKNSLSNVKKISLALGIANGLLYVHQSNVLHRDLKPRNILIDEYGKPKLTGFGLSKSLDAKLGTINTFTDIEWKAPEVIGIKENYSRKSEVYSFGLILWFIFTEKKPFENVPMKDLAAFKQSGKQEAVPDDLPKEIKEILRGCWVLDPNIRWNLEKVIGKLKAYFQSLKPSPEALVEEGLVAEEQGDFTKAFKCYSAAAKVGFFRAKTNVATLLLEGKGCSPNARQACQLLLEAATEGKDTRAMLNLAIMLELGDGVLKDVAKAKHWYQQAAENGDKDAQAKLDEMNQHNRTSGQ